MTSAHSIGSAPEGRSYAVVTSPPTTFVGANVTVTSPMRGGDYSERIIMSENTTPNSPSTNPFDTAENAAKRIEAMTAVLPVLAEAWNGLKTSTATMSAAADRYVAEVRCTFGVLINGTYYPDVYATQQETKKGASTWLKENGFPTGSDDGASTLRYHFTQAAKRLADAAPLTYGPEGWAHSSGKWSLVVVLDEAARKQADEDATIKALQRRETKALAGALAAQASKSPAMVINAMADVLGRTDLSTLTLGDRAAMRTALGSLLAKADGLLEFLGGAVELQAVAS